MKSGPFRLGLIGYPLGHSFSPRLHRAALQSINLAGDYTLFPIPPLPEGQAALRSLLDDLRAGRLDGLNVTIPHKPSVLPLLDEMSPAVRAIGAANTLWMRDGKLVGDNTDIPGFLADLASLVTLPLQGDALVLGAGGSARAVIYALAQSGGRVFIAARRLEQAQSLAAELQPRVSGPLMPLDMHELSQALPACRLVVNTTPLGMHPNPAPCPWPENIPFPPGTAVYDLVYNPPETTLFRRARAGGLAAATGGGMLIEQAALAFERWTGVSPSRQAMTHAFTLGG